MLCVKEEERECGGAVGRAIMEMPVSSLTQPLNCIHSEPVCLSDQTSCMFGQTHCIHFLVLLIPLPKVHCSAGGKNC